MSAPTPQEIRNRLGLVELTLNQAWEELAKDEAVDADTCTFLLSAKTQALHAAALTLLVEAQQAANKIAVAQVLATLKNGYDERDAKILLTEIREEYNV
jgi:hypothetical protein